MNTAIDVAAHSGGGGHFVFLAPGTYNLNSFVIPPYVTVVGSGISATTLVCGNPGYFVRLGGDVSGLRKYGCGIMDLSIQMTHVDGHAIRLTETIGAKVSRLYLESPYASGRSSRAVTIDGGDVSSFFNHFEDVIANHWQTGFFMTTTGTIPLVESGVTYYGEKTTLNHFTNCTVVGDVATVGPGSIGLRVGDRQGSGSVWVGGNLEACAYGVQLESACKSMTFHGARFEGNTKDVYFQGYAGASSFIGCFLDMINGIRNDANSGYDMHSFIACVNGSSLNQGSRMMGENVLVAGRTSDRPLVVEAFPGHTTQLEILLRNSAGTTMFAVNAGGEIAKQAYRSGAASPSGSVTPRYIGEEYLKTSAPAQWFKSTGVSTSSWVALS